MMKIFVAAAISSGLIFTGIFLLASNIKNHPIKPRPKVVDHGPYCDDAYTLNGESIEEHRLLNTLSEKPYEPLENFLIISEGQTLHSIFHPLGISEQEIAMLSRSLRPYLRVTDIAAKDEYRFKIVAFEDRQIIDHLVIRKIDQNRIPLVYRAIRSLDKSSFQVSVYTPPVRERMERLELKVSGTLYQTFNTIPFGTELMQRLMNVFAWNMRMPKDVLAGDEIDILATKRYIYDEFIGFGKITMAIYRQKSRTLTGIFFKSEDNKIEGFFDENGKSLEKEFAISPVFETFATSDQKWRMHPVRKIRLRHNGVDYRGAVGTEFYAIADGEVIEKRFDVNVGNMIRLLHKYGVHSEYFHADSLAENILVGKSVKRGQLLGTIGRTGRLCTGPHLHMGLYTMHGDKKKFIELSSLRKILKSAPDVKAAYAAEFMQQQKALLAQIAKPREKKVDKAVASSSK